MPLPQPDVTGILNRERVTCRVESFCLVCLMSACGGVEENLGGGEGKRGANRITVSTADGVLTSYLLSQIVPVLFLLQKVINSDDEVRSSTHLFSSYE